LIKNNNIIKPEHIDFNALVQNADVSVNFQSKILDELKLNFTESEIQWYMANFYCFLHYHPTNDFPINLENIYKMIGFANKGNAKRTLENNFTAEEDYKILLLPREKQKSNSNTTETRGGHNDETIMINIDCFKSLCMIVKTDKAKEIRKYYIKLENTYNKMVNQEYKEYKVLLEQREQQLIEQENNIQEQLIQKDKQKEIEQQLVLKDNHLVQKDKQKEKMSNYTKLELKESLKIKKLEFEIQKEKTKQRELELQILQLNGTLN